MPQFACERGMRKGEIVDSGKWRLQVEWTRIGEEGERGCGVAGSISGQLKWTLGTGNKGRDGGQWVANRKRLIDSKGDNNKGDNGRIHLTT